MSAEDEIRSRIAMRGRISFAEFMEVALYHPVSGYYSRRAVPASRDDYYTSPAAHPAFGALIAVALWRMWNALDGPPVFHAIEMGAGTGLLARDLLDYVEKLPAGFKRALRYLALDRSPSRMNPEGGPSSYRQLVADGVPLKSLVGCLLSNELVDAFPVHRFEVRGGEVKEVFVALENGRLVEVLDPPSTPELARRIEALGVRLQEGHRGEVNLRIGPWMGEVAAALARGFVLTVDYGYEAAEPGSAAGTRGTVQTYYRHTQAASPYERIGKQDITAHVDFSAIVSAGRAQGLRPVALSTQAQLLRALGLELWLRRLRTMDLPQSRRQANMMAMRELVKPEGLGGFRVLVQERDTGVTELGQLVPADASESGSVWAEELPVPLLRPDHVPLLEGRYPHAAAQFEGPWEEAGV